MKRLAVLAAIALLPLGLACKKREEPTLTIVFGSATPVPHADLVRAREVLERRMRAAGIEHAYASVEKDQVVVRSASIDLVAFYEVWRRPGRLDFVLVADDPALEALASPDPAELVVERKIAGGWAFVAPDGRDPGGRARAFVQQASGKAWWEIAVENVQPPKAWVLDRRTSMTHVRVSDAAVRKDRYGDWELWMELGAGEGLRFESLTAATTGRQLAIVLDGELLMAPTVQESIPGGNVSLRLGGVRLPDERRRETEALAAVLEGGELPFAFVQISLTATPVP